MKTKQTGLSLAMALMTGLVLSPTLANADASPFETAELSNGYMQVAEGGCGGNMPKTGEAKCGGDMAKDHEATCGAEMKDKAGEATCGADMKESAGKAGEGKCGEAKCGGNK